MSDPTATEAQVTKARADLAAAINAVEKSQSAQGGNGGDDAQGGNGAQGGNSDNSDNSGNSGNGGNSGNTSGGTQGSGSGNAGVNLPQTGDAFNMAAVTAAAVLGGAALTAGLGARMTGDSEE